MDKSKLLYRIFEAEAQKRGMDMKIFYRKRKKGLMVFLNSNGEVEWLKRENFRIAAVKKVAYKSKNTEAKHHRKKNKNEDFDFNTLFSFGKNKYFFFGVSAAIIAYLFFKFIELIFGY